MNLELLLSIEIYIYLLIFILLIHSHIFDIRERVNSTQHTAQGSGIAAENRFLWKQSVICISLFGYEGIDNKKMCRYPLGNKILTEIIKFSINRRYLTHLIVESFILYSSRTSSFCVILDRSMGPALAPPSHASSSSRWPKVFGCDLIST